MKTCMVPCECDSTGWWVVTVPELPGAASQARCLDQMSGVSCVKPMVATRQSLRCWLSDP
jgi:hypothetical protein